MISCKASNDSVILNYTKDNAVSFLCQAMLDETLRLRKCVRRKERDSIRNFLTESFRLLVMSNQDLKISMKEKLCEEEGVTCYIK